MERIPSRSRKDRACLGLVFAGLSFSFSAHSASISIYTTDPNQQLILEKSVVTSTRTPSRGAVRLRYDSRMKFQEIEGYGASLTDSSVINLNRLSEGMRNYLLQKLFHPRFGFNISYLRIPIGASDYGVEEYTYSDLPAGEEDLELESFDFSKAKATVKMLKSIRRINPNVKLMISPWSPPAWMKDSGHLRGGSLLTKYYPAFAKYLIKTIEAYADEGLKIETVTIQNEPYFENDKYPSMWMDLADQIIFIRDHFGPMLKQSGFATQILGLDHNYSMKDLGDQLIRGAGDFISGTAFHCYEGRPEDMAGSLGPIYQTECSGIDDGGSFAGSLHWWLQSQVITGGHIGSKLGMAWNLVLDENHGPYIGYCENCRGLVDLDGQDFEVNPELIAMAHAGKFLSRGARRIETAAPPQGADYSYIGYQNPSGSVVLVVANDSKTGRRFIVPDGHGRFFQFTIPPHGVTTVVIEAKIFS